MIILGLSAYAHDSAAAIVKDGRVLFHAEEERFDRKKHSQAFPKNAIRRGLQYLDIKPHEIDHVAFPFQPAREVVENLWFAARNLPHSLTFLKKSDGGTSFWQRNRHQARVLTELRSHFSIRDEVRCHFVNHHLSHAASAVFNSGFEDCAVLSWDGRGESETTVFYKYHQGNFRKLAGVCVPDSLGFFYSAVTQALGFRPFHDEWKVMGLSAYGSDRWVESMSNVLFSDGPMRFRLNRKYFSFHRPDRRFFVSERFEKEFLPVRESRSSLLQDHYDLASAAQRVLEAVGLKLARDLRGASGSRSLCLVGGVALNILLNSKILEEAGFDKVFIMPVSSDAGGSIGAAQWLASRLDSQFNPVAIDNVYWGDEFQEADIEKSLIQAGLLYSRPESIEKKVGEALNDSRVVGWFQGRMESGPRALGNRSILANPIHAETRDRLNKIIKRRESFRPFAPSCLEERLSEYFEVPQGALSPYMILSGRTHKKYRNKLAAVTHIDGTARVHSVSRTQNPKYWSVIHHFEKLSGLPVVLNTSFNESEPIVASPQEALDCFRRTGMDALALGPFWIEKANFDVPS